MNIDNCCSLAYLDCLKHFAIESEAWHLRYPEAKGIPIEKKFMKLDIINSGIKHPVLAGLAIGLLLQIHEKVEQHIFFPDIKIGIINAISTVVPICLLFLLISRNTTRLPPTRRPLNTYNV